MDCWVFARQDRAEASLRSPLSFPAQKRGGLLSSSSSLASYYASDFGHPPPDSFPGLQAAGPLPRLARERRRGAEWRVCLGQAADGPFLFLPQFSQLVLGDVELLSGGSYTLCTDGPLLVRQVLHPEASRKV